MYSWVALCRCFEPPSSKFVSARLGRMVCSEDTRIYTGSGGMSLRPVCCCSCYRHLVYSRGYKRAREGEVPKSLVKGLKSAESLFSCVLVFSLLGRPASPFIGEGEDAGYREKEEKKRGRRRPPRPLDPFPSCGSTNTVDGDGDGSTSGSYSPLVPCPSIVSWSWHPIPSW